MAHDDLILPDHLALMAEAFEDERVEWAYSRPLWVFDDGSVIPFAVDLRRADHLRHFLNTGNTIPASCVVHRRGCLERYGYWDEDLPSAADWVLWKRIIGPSGGSNLAYVSAATALHFRADWRTGSTWGPAPLAAWWRVATDDPWWPAALRVRIPQGLLRSGLCGSRSRTIP